MRAKTVDANNIPDEIYHFTSVYDLVRILEENSMNSRGDIGWASDDGYKTISCTSNPVFYKKAIYKFDVSKKSSRITFNTQQLLNSGYTLKPYVYYVGNIGQEHENEIRIFPLKNIKSTKDLNHFREIDVDWQLENIKKYISNISLVKKYYNKDPYYYDQAKAYLEENNIKYDWI